jgi:hypothetical protein
VCASSICVGRESRAEGSKQREREREREREKHTHTYTVMFATAVRLLARKSAGPKPVKLSELGDGVQPAMDNLFNILKEHGPLTVQDCWKHASQVCSPLPPVS